ncbi:tryptophan-rich antigen, putative (fragment) [Plasmodium knowlesi strain H]|uniref:Tryptophan-rich antigen, putative n=3 Tax=Plasmodium knowlesi TaxID=5850 RepID=A0A5E7X5M6_PLAKH
MESSLDVDNVINKKSSFSTLKVDKSDILFCVNISFLKFCVQCVLLFYSLYIILKHFFPSVFKKLNNTLDSNTLNSIKYGQGYVDDFKEKGNTELKNEDGDVFEDALEEVCTSDKGVQTDGNGIPVEEATSNDKGKENEKEKGDNQIKESEPNAASINKNYNIEKNADVNNEVKAPDYISTVEGKELNKKENSDSNNKEGEKPNIVPENNDTVVNLGGAHFSEKRGTHINNIGGKEEELNKNTKDDKEITEDKGNTINKAPYSMYVKNSTSHVQKAAEESTKDELGEGEKNVDKKKPSNYPIKSDGQVNQNASTSYSFKRGAGSYNNRRRYSSISLESVQETNERETDNYKFKEGRDAQYRSTSSLSKLDEKYEQVTFPDMRKMELGTRKIKKEIVKEKKEDEAKKDETIKDETKKDGTMKDAQIKGARKSDLKTDEEKDQKMGKEELKEVRRAISLDTIYKSDLEGKDEEMENDKSDEWKKNEWNNWLAKTEEDWELFNKSVEDKKNSWLEKEDEELEAWINSMKNRWMHYRENEENEYITRAMRKSSIWGDRQWEQWIRTEGKRGMETDLKKWLNDKESFLNDWISKEWTQWKNERMLEWLAVDWRHKEDETFENYKSSRFTNMLHMKNRKKWMKWKERTDKEKEEWNNWVRGKEHLYVINKWDKWLKWKREKRALYSQKFMSFINECINKKQWVVWIEDQKDSTLKKK